MQACVFCGSAAGNDPQFEEMAREVGYALADRSIGLVYGGASAGVMGTLADAVLESKGTVLGIIPPEIVKLELAHPGVTEMRVVESLPARKTMMFEEADFFLTLPGGCGTLDELFEVMTLFQLKQQHKPCGILNLDGYFDGLLAWLDRAVKDGFVGSEAQKYLQVGTSVNELLDEFII